MGTRTQRWARGTIAALVAAGMAAVAGAQGGGAPGAAGPPGEGRPPRVTTQPSKADAKHPRVRMETSLGVVVLELDAEKAPITVANFLKYVESGFYDATIFHRVMPTFMIQGGGHVSLREQKVKGLRPAIQNEARNGLKNRRGTIAMARTGDPHSATSQFFINVADNPNLDYPSFDGWGYCVFGKVVEGMEVVDQIKEVETRSGPGGEKSQPINPPVIKAVKKL